MERASHPVRRRRQRGHHHVEPTRRLELVQQRHGRRHAVGLGDRARHRRHPLRRRCRPTATGHFARASTIRSGDLWFMKENDCEQLRSRARPWAPKLARKVWKPVVTAVHGLCAGGAEYFLNESDIDHLLGRRRVLRSARQRRDRRVRSSRSACCTVACPSGDVLRWALMGNEERITAADRAPPRPCHRGAERVSPAVREHGLGLAIAPAQVRQVPPQQQGEGLQGDHQRRLDMGCPFGHDAHGGVAELVVVVRVHRSSQRLTMATNAGPTGAASETLDDHRGAMTPPAHMVISATCCAVEVRPGRTHQRRCRSTNGLQPKRGAAIDV